MIPLSPSPSPAHNDLTTAGSDPTPSAIAFGVMISVSVALACLFLRGITRLRGSNALRNQSNMDDESQEVNSAKESSGPGLEKSLLDKIKVAKFARKAGVVRTHECAVCLNSFEGDDSIRALPQCKHAFHVPCIDRWFESHANCPICREDMAIMCSNMAMSASFDQNNSVSININAHAADDHRLHFNDLQGFDSFKLMSSAHLLMPPPAPDHHLPSLLGRDYHKTNDGPNHRLQRHYRNLLRKSFSAGWDAKMYEHTESAGIPNMEKNVVANGNESFIMLRNDDAMKTIAVHEASSTCNDDLKKGSHAKTRAKSFGSLASFKKKSQSASAPILHQDAPPTHLRYYPM